MCASSRIFLVPVPVNVARTILPICVGRVLHLVDVGRLDQLDLAAQRLQPAGDQLGDPVEPFDVAAAGLDRHQLFQRLEQRLLLLLRLRR